MFDVYEFMKHTLIASAFGMMVGFWIWSIKEWSFSIVRWVRKKIHDKHHPGAESENTSQE